MAAYDTTRPARTVDDLTMRQRAILALVADGWQDKEIAATLSISHNTVNRHLSILRQRTGCRNRAALAGWLYRQTTQEAVSDE